MTIYDRISYALKQGMNIKLALMATGLDEKTFWLYFEDELFSSEQLKELRKVLNEFN